MKKLLFMFLFMISLTAFGQEAGMGTSQQIASQVEMADTMRQDGKIFVVVAVILLILIGIIIYLFILERKISRIEKNVDNHQFV